MKNEHGLKQTQIVIALVNTITLVAYVIVGIGLIVYPAIMQISSATTDTYVIITLLLCLKVVIVIVGLFVFGAIVVCLEVLISLFIFPTIEPHKAFQHAVDIPILRPLLVRLVGWCDKWRILRIDRKSKKRG